MKWKRAMTVISFASLLLLPTSGNAELEGHSFIDESIKGFRVYKRPKITIPAGWREHEAAGQETRGVFLIRDGKELQNSEVTIYAIAISKERSSQSLQSFVKGDIDHFKKNAKQGTVTKIPDIKNASGQLTAYQSKV
jgi:hypothetical protein